MWYSIGLHSKWCDLYCLWYFMMLRLWNPWTCWPPNHNIYRCELITYTTTELPKGNIIHWSEREMLSKGQSNRKTIYIALYMCPRGCEYIYLCCMMCTEYRSLCIWIILNIYRKPQLFFWKSLFGRCEGHLHDCKRVCIIHIMYI